ncbi:MAG: phytanoyl-CoA dioxygenase family protein [Gemmataceae bacterium]
MPAILSDDAVRQYHADGYVLARGFFDAEEIDLLRLREGRQRPRVSNRSGGPMAKAVSCGCRCGTTRATASMACSPAAIAWCTSCEKKLPRRRNVPPLEDDPQGREEGRREAWAWHQDYGYWYQNGVLEPLLTSVFIAVDRCTIENGCHRIRNSTTRPHQSRTHGRSGRGRSRAC